MTSLPSSSHAASRSAASGAGTDLKFWLGFLGLNLLLFLPLYLLNIQHSTFFPRLEMFSEGILTTLKKLFSRENYDVFRLNLELTLLVGLGMAGFGKRRGFRWLLTGVFVALLLYYVYDSTIWYIYAMPPVLYNDHLLIQEGARLAMDVFSWSNAWQYLLPVLLLIGISYGAHRLMGWIVQVEWPRLHPASRMVFLGLCLVMGLGVFWYNKRMALPSAALSSGGIKVYKNVVASQELARAMAAYNPETVDTTYAYAAYPLRNKPNIVLVFVESYGSLLLTHETLREPYTHLLTALDTLLTPNGWHVASALSKAPIIGGQSWLAYTSVLFGLHVDNQGTYRFLLNQYQDRTYPDFGHYLKTQGYTYYRLTALPERQINKIPWAAYTNLYNLDHWMHHADLNFTGAGYGWGPSPPDQYSLNAAHAQRRAKDDQPYLLFYITQNSHYPWTYMPEVVEDWQTLNTPHAKGFAAENVLHEATPENYFGAIDYQLRFLTDFILRTGDAHTLYFIIGDHQPPLLTHPGDAYTTPIHLIGQDSTFIHTFETYGLSRGLHPDLTATPLKHEGLYSMWMQALIQSYGDPTQVPPVYRPEGIRFDIDE